MLLLIAILERMCFFGYCCTFPLNINAAYINVSLSYCTDAMSCFVESTSCSSQSGTNIPTYLLVSSWESFQLQNSFSGGIHFLSEKRRTTSGV